MNFEICCSVIRKLESLGVREVCICPGSRNSPLIVAFKEMSKITSKYYFFEERAASFFALGRIRSTNRPVAVVTTSGTAAGELLPAAMEAYYSGLNLILVTADRPRHYRGSGSPQSAEQVGLYGQYVSETFDLAQGESLPCEIRLINRPIHFNICLEEPLLAGRELLRDQTAFSDTQQKPAPGYSRSSAALAGIEQISAFFERSKNPIVIVGMLQPDERSKVADSLLRWRVPTYCEGTSGLREDSRLHAFRIFLPKQIFEKAEKGEYPIDGVIRIGGVPTLRPWRDLESSRKDVPVLSISRLSFSGLGRKSYSSSGEVGSLCELIDEEVRKLRRCQEEKNCRNFIRLDHQSRMLLTELLLEEPRSEAGMIHRLSWLIPSDSQIFLGNSLPIREWDLAATTENRGQSVWASRGANGIDGQVSAFLGYAAPECQNWGLFGDLTAFYDLSAPWILQQMKSIRTNLAVINNGGGKIFSRMYPSDVEIQNLHDFGFRGWAAMWKLDYHCWDYVPEILVPSDTHRIIEIIPDEPSTQRFWDKYEKI